jgi:hypothetical protein
MNIFPHLSQMCGAYPVFPVDKDRRASSGCYTYIDKRIREASLGMLIHEWNKCLAKGFRASSRRCRLCVALYGPWKDHQVDKPFQCAERHRLAPHPSLVLYVSQLRRLRQVNYSGRHRSRGVGLQEIRPGADFEASDFERSLARSHGVQRSVYDTHSRGCRHPYCSGQEEPHSWWLASVARLSAEPHYFRKNQVISGRRILVFCRLGGSGSPTRFTPSLPWSLLLPTLTPAPVPSSALSSRSILSLTLLRDHLIRIAHAICSSHFSQLQRCREEPSSPATRKHLSRRHLFRSGRLVWTVYTNQVRRNRVTSTLKPVSKSTSIPLPSSPTVAVPLH